MNKIDFIQSICEEFTDVILTDKKKNTVIFHLPGKFFKEVNNRLIEKGFELTFKKKTAKSSFTCCYTLLKNKK